MIALILGTTAELIKASPVMRSLAERGNAVEIWNTAMHVSPLNDAFALLAPDIRRRDLHDTRRTHDIARLAQIPGWISEVIGRTYRDRKSLRSALAQEPPSLVLVHGDTLTTVLGSLVAKSLKVPVAHIEAGFRSGNIWAPFPEELDRRLVSRLADIHFAPGDRDAANLKRVSGRVINTGENTAIDALRGRVEAQDLGGKWPDRYGVVTLHRFELMRRKSAVRDILSACREAARERTIFFFTGAHGAARLAAQGLTEMFDDRLRLADKLSFDQFAPAIANAEFVLTDSGGLQLECAYLGVPCLVHRQYIETWTGVGENVAVSNFDMAVVRDFLKDPSRWRRPSRLHDHHPSAIIVDSLVELGFAR